MSLDKFQGEVGNESRVTRKRNRKVELSVDASQADNDKMSY